MTNREMIEACLTPTMRAALDELCASLGVPRDRWRSVPALAQVFETAAVARSVERLRHRPRVRLSTEFCERLAADTLGLEYKTVQKRRHRWRAMTNTRGPDDTSESVDPRVAPSNVSTTPPTHGAHHERP